MNNPLNKTEKVTIKKVTYVTTKEGKDLVILHTTPCKELKDKDGQPVARFKLARKVFEQRAKEVGKPTIIFERDCIGASYEYVYQPVKAGQAFLNGEGQYTIDHNAKVSDSITISAAVQAKDDAAIRTAYYNHMFSATPSVESSPVVMTTTEEEGNGNDIPA